MRWLRDICFLSDDTGVKEIGDLHRPLLPFFFSHVDILDVLLAGLVVCKVFVTASPNMYNSLTDSAITRCVDVLSQLGHLR
jgi:hypothetical protein